MKIRNKLLASALALAIGLPSAFAAEQTDPWWNVDFTTGYTNGGLVTNSTPTDGDWSSTGADVSIMTNTTVASKSGNMAKLDTQGGSLIWTPTGAVTSCKRTLIDTDVYLVGSDEAPTTVTTGVQTEVYLKNLMNTTTYAVTGSVLCAHVGNGSGGAEWVELEGFAISHQTWVKLSIELDYSTPITPRVSFKVNDFVMNKKGVPDTIDFPVINVKVNVESVAFMGTGYVDNFLGMKVTEQALPAYSSLADAYITGTGATNGTSFNVSSENVLTATFPALNGTDTLKYVQLTGANDYVRTYRTSTAGVAQFDVSDLAAGTYSVTAYYGDAPTVVPSAYAPAAEASGGKPAAEVVEGNLVVNVNPVSGLYYTLFVGTDGAQPGDLSAAAASTLAFPDDEDAKFLQIQMPAPTTPNGVNLIKIYASDEAYAADDDAPDAL